MRERDATQDMDHVTFHAADHQVGVQHTHVHKVQNRCAGFALR